MRRLWRLRQLLFAERFPICLWVLPFSAASLDGDRRRFIPLDQPHLWEQTKREGRRLTPPFQSLRSTTTDRTDDRSPPPDVAPPPNVTIYIMPDGMRRIYRGFGLIWFLGFVAFAVTRSATLIPLKGAADFRTWDYLFEERYWVGGNSPGSLMALGLAGFVILGYIAPMIFYLIMRRPVFQDFNQLIPLYRQNEFRHCPWYVGLTSGGKPCWFRTVWQFIIHMTPQFSHKRQPYYWRPAIRNQHALQKLAYLQYLRDSFRPNRPLAFIDRIIFIFGAPLTFYTLLWLTNLFTTVNTGLLSGLAFVWSITTIVHIHKFFSMLLRLVKSPMADRTNPRVPLKLYEDTNDIKQRLEDIGTGFYLNSLQIIAAVMLISLLTFFSLDSNPLWSAPW